MAREDEIKLIAYGLWEEDGCCHGRDVEHWIRAEMIWEEQNKTRAAATRPPVAQKSPAQSEKTPAKQTKPVRGAKRKK